MPVLIRHLWFDFKQSFHLMWWWSFALVSGATIALVVMATAISRSPSTWAIFAKANWAIFDSALLGVVIYIDILLICLIMPGILYQIFRVPTVSISQSALATRKRAIVLFVSIFTLIFFFTFPVLYPVFNTWNYSGSSTVWTLAVGPIAVSYRLLQLGIKYHRQTRELGNLPKLDPILNPAYRPRKSWQTNVDIGSVAPRIGAVVSGLAKWSKFFESSAPTSKSIWGFIRDADHEQAIRTLEEKAHAPSRAIKGLKRSTWRGVEELRFRISEMLCVTDSSIFFTTSTTRAIEAALIATAKKVKETESHSHVPEVVFLPSFSEFRETEHGAELGRLQSLKEVFGADICRIPIDQLPFTDLDEEQFNVMLAQLLHSTVLNDSRKSKTLLISHVTYAGGLIMPIEELVELWKRDSRPYRLIVDGAHAVGQIDTKVPGQVDAYLFSAHKWLLGPAAMGIGVLRNDEYEGKSEVERRFRHLVYEGLAWKGGDPSNEGAATVAIDPFVGLAESLGVIERLGDTVDYRLRALNQIFRRKTELECTNFEVIDTRPFSQAPGILVLQKKGSQNFPTRAILEIATRLEFEHSMVAKAVTYPVLGQSYAGLRICLPFYLATNDLTLILAKLDSCFGMQT